MAHACSIETGMRRRSKERGVPAYINSAKPSLREYHMKLRVELAPARTTASVSSMGLPLAEPNE